MNIVDQRRLTALDFAIRTSGHNGQEQVLAAAEKYLAFLAPARKPSAKKAPARKAKR